MSSAIVTVAVPLGELAIAAPLPELLSQKNVESVTGIPARVFLDTLRAPGFPVAVHRLGKLRLVDRAAFSAWLRSARAAAPETEAAPANDVPHKPTGEDVLEELGFERADRPRKAR